MSLIQLDINHDIADGNLVSSALQIDANQASILAKFTDIPTSDVVVSLEQSLDAVNYTPVPDSSKTLDIAHELHQWNVTGLVAGMYIRLTATVNTALTGSIDFMKIITSRQ